jgi:hypothetical protein
MAVYPCSIGQHRYGGAQRSVYLTRLNGVRPVTRKHRLCGKHFDAMKGNLQRTFQVVDDNGTMASECINCTNPRATTLFARTFEGGDEGMQYAADLCADCALGLLAELAWDTAIEL